MSSLHLTMLPTLHQLLLQDSPKLRAGAMKNHSLITLANPHNVTDLVGFQSFYTP